MRNLASLAMAVVVSSSLVATADRDDILIADFEGDDYHGWQAAGSAFGSGPARGTLSGQQPVTGFLGRGLVNTFHNGDAGTGTLTSPKFKIQRGAINFLIGGGNHPAMTCINLLVDGRVVRTATGTASTGSDDEHLSWRTWDVRDLQGNAARIQIVDHHTGGWGHINVDQILQSDRRRQPTLAHDALALAASSVLGAVPRAASDPLRPIYHVMPPALWCNDPNGPLYYKGYHHLFYQHNPYGDRWEHMHWGHVRSKDLVTWEHCPMALWPSLDKGEAHCFSGSAAVNGNGRPMIFYTSIGPKREPEQWAAVSDDEMMSWKKTPTNPLLTMKLHGDVKVADWRDPFVFKENGRWYMVVGGHRVGGKGCILLYGSDDLLEWKFLGIPFEGAENNWECPNFFKLGDQWVLICSPHGLVRYYTGRMDWSTHRFHPKQSGTLDFGRDFYAPNCLEDETHRRVLWGWVKGFKGGRGWNGCLTIPRVLEVANDGRLIATPAPELQKLRGAALAVKKSIVVDHETKTLNGVRGNCLEMVAQLDCRDSKLCGLRVRSSADGLQGLNIATDGKHLFVSGTKAPLTLAQGQHTLRIHLFLDNSVVEVFTDAGATVTQVIDIAAAHQGVRLFADGGSAQLVSLESWPMRTIWAENKPQ